MNFQTAPSVCEAITKRLEHQVFGYFNPSEDYYNSIINWQKVRNGVEAVSYTHLDVYKRQVRAALYFANDEEE